MRIRFFAEILAVILVVSFLAVRRPMTNPSLAANQLEAPRRANIPYFNDSVDWAQSAIFWFGINEQGIPSKNYADVRVAYTSQALEVQVTVIDYYLWYKTDPQSTDDLSQYEAVEIYLDTHFDRASLPQLDDFRFLLGTRHWQDVENYQREARGNGTGWEETWNGSWDGWGGMSWSDVGPNNNSGNIDYGWTAGFVIPWETLGYTGPPDNNTLMGLGVVLYDRDANPPAGAVAPQYWPESLLTNNPTTWGEIHFGEAEYHPETSAPTGSIIIRASSDKDNTVEDAWMGGGGLCAGGHNGGSEENHGGDDNLFTGSETAPTHFPCFNKSFLRFQLDTIPPGMEIISATFTLHLFGNADQSIAPPYSWTHLFSISDDWDEMGIHWNNAPMAQENIDVIRVYPYSQPGNIIWPGDSYTWDASKAVAEAYFAGNPLNIALYSSDTGRDTSKYYSSSETGDWNEDARPTLKVTWGEASPKIEITASSFIASRDDVISYQLIWKGNDQEQFVSDQLPLGLSAPFNIQTNNIGSASYDVANHEIIWNGKPNLGEDVVLSFQITVEIDGPKLLMNTANLSYANGQLISTDQKILFIDPIQVYLPLATQ